MFLLIVYIQIPLIRAKSSRECFGELTVRLSQHLREDFICRTLCVCPNDICAARVIGFITIVRMLVEIFKVH